nr:AI-2E family transporter [Clostridiales bacterium]
GGGCMLKDRKTKQIFLYILFAVILFACAQHLSFFGTLLVKTFNVLLPVIIGLCVAFILNVPMSSLENKLFGRVKNSKKKGIRKLARPLSLVLTIILTLGAIVLLLLIIIPKMKDAIILLAGKIPHYAERLANWAEPIVNRYELGINLEPLRTLDFSMHDVQSFAKHFLSVDFSDTNNIINSTFSFTSSVISGAVDFALGIVIALYVLAEKEKIGRFTTRFLRNILPQRAYDKTFECSKIANEAYSSFISGQFTDAFILALLCFTGMSIFRFPNAAIISVAVGVSAVIPVIGSFIGEGIGFILICMESPLKAVLFLLFMQVLQTIDNNLIYPRIVGKKVGLPGLLVVVAVIIGGNIAGILGVLLGVPTVSAIYSIIIRWMSEREKKKQAFKDAVALAEEDGGND